MSSASDVLPEDQGDSEFWKRIVGEFYSLFASPVAKRLFPILDGLPHRDFKNIVEYVVSIFHFCLSDFGSGMGIPHPPVKALQFVVASLLELSPRVGTSQSEAGRGATLPNDSKPYAPEDVDCPADLATDDDWAIQYAETLIMTKVMINHFLPEWVTSSRERNSRVVRQGQRRNDEADVDNTAPGVASSEAPCEYRFPEPHPFVEFILSLLFSPPVACLTFAFLVGLRRIHSETVSSIAHNKDKPCHQLWNVSSIQEALQSSWGLYGADVVVVSVALVTKIFHRHDPEVPVWINDVTRTGTNPCEGDVGSHISAELLNRPTMMRDNTTFPHLDPGGQSPSREDPRPPPPVQMALSILMHLYTHYLLFHSSYSTLIRDKLLPLFPSCLVDGYGEYNALYRRTTTPHIGAESDAWTSSSALPMFRLLASDPYSPEINNRNPFEVSHQTDSSHIQSHRGWCPSLAHREPSLTDLFFLLPSMAFLGFRGCTWPQMISSSGQWAQGGRSHPVPSHGGDPDESLHRVCTGTNMGVCALICIRDVLRLYIRQRLGLNNADGRSAQQDPPEVRDWTAELRNILKSVPKLVDGDQTALESPRRRTHKNQKLALLLARVVRKWFEITVLTEAQTGPSDSTQETDESAQTPQHRAEEDDVGGYEDPTPYSPAGSNGSPTSMHNQETPPPTDGTAATFLTESTLLKIIRKYLYGFRVGEVRGTSGRLEFSLLNLCITGFEISKCQVCLQTVGKSYKPTDPSLSTNANDHTRGGGESPVVRSGPPPASMSCTPPPCPPIATSPVCHQPHRRAGQMSTERRPSSRSESSSPLEMSTSRDQPASEVGIGGAHISPDVEDASALLLSGLTSRPTQLHMMTPTFPQPRSSEASRGDEAHDLVLSEEGVSRRRCSRRLIDEQQGSCAGGHATTVDRPVVAHVVEERGVYVEKDKAQPNIPIASQEHNPIELSTPQPHPSAQQWDSHCETPTGVRAEVMERLCSDMGDYASPETLKWYVVESRPQSSAESLPERGPASTEYLAACVHLPQPLPTTTTREGPISRPPHDAAPENLTSHHSTTAQDDTRSEEQQTPGDNLPQRVRAEPILTSPSHGILTGDGGGVPSSKSIHFRLSTDHLVIKLTHDWIAKVSPLGRLGINGSARVQLSECGVTCLASLSMNKGFCLHSVAVKILNVDIALSCTSSLPQLLAPLLIRLFKETLRSYIELRVKSILTYRIERICESANYTIWRRLRALIPESLLAKSLDFVDYSIPLDGIFV